jgi:hypothetical protein
MAQSNVGLEMCVCVFVCMLVYSFCRVYKDDASVTEVM